MVLTRRPRPAYGAPHVGFDLVPPPFRRPTPHDELRDAPRPGAPAHAGSLPTRFLEVVGPTPVHDQRGTIAAWLRGGEVVPVAKGVGAAGAIVDVITDGPLAGRIIHRHRPTILGNLVGRPAVRGGEGPA